MSSMTLREALGPLAARMGKAVREHEILRVAATLRGQDGVNVAEKAQREILAWAEKRCGGRLPSEAWEYQDFEHFSGGRDSLGVRIKNDNSDLWAIRVNDPDKKIPGRIWTTEVVVGRIDESPPKFSVRLLANTSEGELNIEPHTPGFVQQVAEKCGLLHDSYELLAKPWVTSSVDEAERLVDLLIDPYRRLPVFVLTVSEDSPDPDQPLLDPISLGRAVLGLAHVVVLPSALTWRVTERLEKQRSVFGGAIRAYLPGFDEDADPYAHRLVVADRIRAPGGIKKFERWIRTLAASESMRRNRLGQEVLALASIRSVSLKLKQLKLEEAGASDIERLNAANKQIKVLESQAKENEISLEYFADEHKNAEERAETAETQVRTSAFYIQQLLDQITARGESPDTNIKIPDSWDGFTDWCDTHLAGRVVLSQRARRVVRSPIFNDVSAAARCLVWLANDYRDRRINGGGALVDESVEEGIWNARCGSDEFEIDWQGHKHTADWHIKSGGNTHNPERCLRIYYFWDERTRQIVIAEMPAHRPSGAS